MDDKKIKSGEDESQQLIFNTAYNKIYRMLRDYSNELMLGRFLQISKKEIHETIPIDLFNEVIAALQTAGWRVKITKLSYQISNPPASFIVTNCG